MAESDVTSRPRRARRLRRQIDRWARARPNLLSHATTTAVAIAFFAVSAPLEVALYDLPALPGLLLLAVQCSTLVLALRLRIVAAAVFAAATVTMSLWTEPTSAPWPWTLTGILGFAFLVGTVSAVAGWRVGVLAYAIPAVTLMIPIVISLAPQRLANGIVALGVGAAAAVVGGLLRGWMRVSRQLVEERSRAEAEVEKRMVVEERQRIARELHDVVAHGLSLIQVQAEFARYRFPHMPSDVGAEVEDIARTARTALDEMRQMLGALRNDEPAEKVPQPTLGDLPTLVDDAVRAGAEIDLHMSVTVSTPTPVGIAAYRIVQEGISNAVRHAPGAPINVAVTTRNEALLVTVVNGPVAAAGPAAGVQRRQAAGTGHGLIGMRERASMLQGTLSVAPTSSGGFRVEAALPLEGSPTYRAELAPDVRTGPGTASDG